MKTLLLLLALALTGRSLLADDACCAAAPVAAARPLTDRSLYQLDAAWTDDAGRAVLLAELRGQPVVVGLFFASCTYACPILVQDAQKIRAALPADLRDRVRFVFVSFDSARDTPAALRAFRARQRLGDAAWTLLRGEPAAVQELAMLLGVQYRRDASGDYAHSNLLTVLNAEGEIVHQQLGLQGEIAESVRALTLALR